MKMRFSDRGRRIRKRTRQDALLKESDCPKLFFFITLTQNQLGYICASLCEVWETSSFLLSLTIFRRKRRREKKKKNIQNKHHSLSCYQSYRISVLECTRLRVQAFAHSQELLKSQECLKCEKSVWIPRLCLFISKTHTHTKQEAHPQERK